MRATGSEEKEQLREQYYSGKISAKRYLEALKASEEGDRERRQISKEFQALVARIGVARFPVGHS